MKKLRPIRIDGDSAYIQLTQGYEAIIDSSDIHLVNSHNWSARIAKHADGSIRSVYAFRNTRQGGLNKMIFMHRIISNTPDGLHTDHVDGNGLNNRKSNLRHATPAQNTHNRRISATNSSGKKGVTWNRSSKKWQAQIRANGRNIYLGVFENINDAALVCAQARNNLHGNFSCHS